VVRYNSMELMICSAAKILEDNSVVVVGTGAPCASAMLAQKTCSPHLVILFEAGGVAPDLPTMPISVGDSRTYYKGISATSMDEIMELCQKGMVDYAFIGGAQIDQYGNINSTMIGTDYYQPIVRLPGSGGANDLASLCRKLIVITPQERRRFVKKLDFLTTPGFLDGPGSRERSGLPADTGPYKVITDLAIIGYDVSSRRMKVESLHPGVSKKRVEENSSFELLIDDDLIETLEPKPEELELLRKEIDPLGYIIGRA
jgi:glutaconate CoA-transferase subunit B